MRVVVISSSIFSCPPSGYSGLEMIAWLTAKGLAEKGHSVALVAPDGSTCPGAEVIPCGPAGQVDEHSSYGGFPEIKNGDQLVRRKHDGYWQKLLDASVICDHSWQKWCLQLKAEGVLKAPVLSIMHAPINTMFGSWPPRYPLLPSVEKGCCVCISQDQADHFEALFSPYKARVARNGVDVDHYRPMGIPRSKRYLFLARFSTIKGPDLAITACKRAGVGLDMVGDTSITNEPAFFEECKRQADGDQVKIIGGVPRGETVYWYNQAHCMLHLNQRFREPLGLAPLEAMACGTPVIAWRYGALKETVLHNETGFLVESLDEVVELIKTDAPSTINRNRCREFVCDTFTVRHMVDRYDALIHEAVQTGGW